MTHQDIADRLHKLDDERFEVTQRVLAAETVRIEAARADLQAACGALGHVYVVSGRSFMGDAPKRRCGICRLKRA